MPTALSLGRRSLTLDAELDLLVLNRAPLIRHIDVLVRSVLVLLCAIEALHTDLAIALSGGSSGVDRWVLLDLLDLALFAAGLQRWWLFLDCWLDFWGTGAAGALDSVNIRVTLTGVSE